MDAELNTLSAEIGQALADKKLVLACAESCTGGWISEIVTATAGSSGWFDCGFVTYSNAAKQTMLGVEADLLNTHGAVSEETALAMVHGTLDHSAAQVALAVTGVAGPGGGSPGKPVGTVCFAWCRVGQAGFTETRHFSGGRESIRRQTVVYSLRGLLALLNGAKTVP